MRQRYNKTVGRATDITVKIQGNKYTVEKKKGHGNLKMNSDFT